MNYPMTADDALPTPAQRLSAYRQLAADLERFFSAFIASYCRNCRLVIARMPEAVGEETELLSGVDPGCCHRGAGDIFRLEGQSAERRRLAPELAEELGRERRRLFGEGEEGTEYVYRRLRDGEVLRGAHCRYFGPRGCRLGNLKGPLCLNFICPPIRRDLLQVCRREPEIIGPENDFLHIYRTMASIAYDHHLAIRDALAASQGRLARLESRCRDFLARRQLSSLAEYFQAEPGSADNI